MPVKHIARVHFRGAALGSNRVCVQRTTSPLRALIMQGLGKGGHKHTKERRDAMLNVCCADYTLPEGRAPILDAILSPRLP